MAATQPLAAATLILTATTTRSGGRARRVRARSRARRTRKARSRRRTRRARRVRRARSGERRCVRTWLAVVESRGPSPSRLCCPTAASRRSVTPTAIRIVPAVSRCAYHRSSKAVAAPQTMTSTLEQGVVGTAVVAAAAAAVAARSTAVGGRLQVEAEAPCASHVAETKVGVLACSNSSVGGDVECCATQSQACQALGWEVKRAHGYLSG